MLFLVVDVPDNVHESVSTDSGEDMPPAMQLQEPSPGQPHLRPKTPQLRTELEINVPKKVPKQADENGLPLPAAPGPDLGLWKPGLRPAIKVQTAQRNQKDLGRKGQDVVDDLARPNIEGRK